MPTPVSVARQCLADEAAAALDEAVIVAKRRGHAQTTSLHAVSALLSLPSSSIREACTRPRIGACSPRLQFRALELSVGVALDRLSVSKSADEPPVSNSLMAAIKRSQANQRRHPDTFHLYQRQQLNPGSDNFSSISAVKVELKHFVMSILDDPIVSRVFGDAGFRTNEVKWAILNPLPVSRFSSSSTASRCPPLFLRSLSDLGSSKPGPNFPFTVDFPTEKCDENSRRVGEILMKRNKRNPLLIGNCAKDALRNFMDCLKRNESGILPKEIDGLSVISIESEFIIGEFHEKTMQLKFKQVGDMLKDCQGPGFIMNCGDLKVLLDAEKVDAVNMVSKLKELLINSGGKSWVIGFLAGDDHYKKFVERFPCIEMDWDLQLLPITTSSIGGKSFKSSLMGSFVPLGGFFPMPFELETLRTNATQSPSLCNLCHEKYEAEASEISKGATTGSIADKHLSNLSSWLHITHHETINKPETVEAKDDKTVLDARVMALKRKWSDICLRVHSSLLAQEDISKANSQNFSVPSFQNIPIRRDTSDVGSVLNGSVITNLSPCLPSDLQKNILLKQNVPIASVTTDLGLGKFGSHQLDKQMYMKDPWKILAEKVCWQIDAVQTIGRTISCCSNKENVWISFLGPDKVGKRKIAAGLAEIVFGSKESLFSLDLRMQDVIYPSNTIIDSKHHDLKSGRKMIVDYLAEELKKRPSSVVFVENIERADICVQDSLSQAIKTGKFPDSHGRDISIKNTVFVLTSSVLKVSEDRRLASEFSEEKILEAKNLQMQILVRSGNGNYSKNSSANVSVTPSEVVPNQFSVNKRKLICNESLEATKLKRSMIDLNLPVKDMEEESDIDDDDDNENSELWLEELLEHVDENIEFKPFDFDFLYEKILMEIDVRLKKAVGEKIFLEIDREVVVQILAAAWLAGSEDALKDWIKNILCSSIEEARKRCDVTSGIVMQLVQCSGLVEEQHASGLCLPSRININ